MPRTFDRATAKGGVYGQGKAGGEEQQAQSSPSWQFAQVWHELLSERRRIDARQSANFQAAIVDHVKIYVAITRGEHGRIAAAHPCGGRRFEQDHPASGRKVRNHGRQRRAKQGRIEDVLKNGNSQNNVKLLLETELRQ